jgi:hypothetical protein
MAVTKKNGAGKTGGGRGGKAATAQKPAQKSQKPAQSGPKPSTGGRRHRVKLTSAQKHELEVKAQKKAKKITPASRKRVKDFIEKHKLISAGFGKYRLKKRGPVVYHITYDDTTGKPIFRDLRKEPASGAQKTGNYALKLKPGRKPADGSHLPKKGTYKMKVKEKAEEKKRKPRRTPQERQADLLEKKAKFDLRVANLKQKIAKTKKKLAKPNISEERKKKLEGKLARYTATFKERVPKIRKNLKRKLRDVNDVIAGKKKKRKKRKNKKEGAAQAAPAPAAQTPGKGNKRGGGKRGGKKAQAPAAQTSGKGNKRGGKRGGKK